MLMYELALLYCQEPDRPLIEKCTLAFAERKYRQILEWSKTLSLPMQETREALGRDIVFR